MIEEKKNPASFHRLDHLANERTFLAWIRTSIAIMALGFVVEKFAFFLDKMSYLFHQDKIPTPNQHDGSFFGLALVAIGAVLGLCSYLRYHDIQKQIDEETHHPSNLLALFLTTLVVVAGVILFFYLF